MRNAPLLRRNQRGRLSTVRAGSMQHCPALPNHCRLSLEIQISERLAARNPNKITWSAPLCFLTRGSLDPKLTSEEPEDKTLQCKRGSAGGKMCTMPSFKSFDKSGRSCSSSPPPIVAHPSWNPAERCRQALDAKMAAQTTTQGMAQHNTKHNTDHNTNTTQLWRFRLWCLKL